MRNHLLVLLAFAALTWPMAGQAQCLTTLAAETLCPPPDSQCVLDRYRVWTCSKPGGSAVLDQHGAPVCGAGECVRDINNLVMCSTEPHGSAALNVYARAVCTGGCALATAGQCKPLKKKK